MNFRILLTLPILATGVHAESLEQVATTGGARMAGSMVEFVDFLSLKTRPWVEQAPLRGITDKVIADKEFEAVPRKGAEGYYQRRIVDGDPKGARTNNYVTVWGRHKGKDFEITEIELGWEKWTATGPDRLYVDNWMFILNPDGSKRDFSHSFMLQNSRGHVLDNGRLEPKKGDEIDPAAAEVEAKTKLKDVIEFWKE